MKIKKDYTPEDYDKNNLDKFNYDEHIWEVGHFGEKNNGFSAYGFRQDGGIIRITSKYEAELIYSLFQMKMTVELLTIQLQGLE